MDRSRIIVLVVAAVAAGGVALLARSLMGGGTAQTAAAPAPQLITTEVLVAASQLTAGSQLTPASVRWEKWPRTDVDPTFITQDSSPDVSKIVQGAVVRSPMAANQPLTQSLMIHGNASGVMAAMLDPGMRAVSITISVDTGAGGFILPNDHVDVLCTQQAGDHKFQTRTILKDVRVLAVDQTYDSSNSANKSATVVGRTATLELTPAQSELIERAKAGGTLSLALRALVENEPASGANAAKAASDSDKSSGDTPNNEIDVLRYGVERSSIVGAKE